MDELNKKYFVTELIDNSPAAPWYPKFAKHEATKVLRLDDNVIKDSSYLECAWFWPGKWPEDKAWEKMGVQPHVHEYPEVLTFFGTNPNDVYDLGGQVELWIDNEQYLIEQSVIVFIPADTEHGPLYIRRVDRPIFHFSSGTGKNYI